MLKCERVQSSHQNRSLCSAWIVQMLLMPRDVLKRVSDERCTNCSKQVFHFAQHPSDIWIIAFVKFTILTVLSFVIYRLPVVNDCPGQTARVTSNLHSSSSTMAVSRVPSPPLQEANTPVAESWCYTQVSLCEFLRLNPDLTSDYVCSMAHSFARSFFVSLVLKDEWLALSSRVD